MHWALGGEIIALNNAMHSLAKLGSRESGWERTKITAWIRLNLQKLDLQILLIFLFCYLRVIITRPDFEHTEVYIWAWSASHIAKCVTIFRVLYVVVSMGTTEVIAHLKKENWKCRSLVLWRSGLHVNRFWENPCMTMTPEAFSMGYNKLTFVEDLQISHMTAIILLSLLASL